MKKVSSLFLVVILVISLCSAFAAETNPSVSDGPTPRYTGISVFSGKLDVSGTVATVNAQMGVYSGYTGSIVAEVQERTPNGSWKYLTTFTATTKNCQAAISSATCTAQPGNSYRVYFTFTAYNGRGEIVDCENRYSSVQIA